MSRAFQESSAKRAENGLIVMFPADRADLGDVYVKTGVLRGHGVFVVKVSPWFAANVENRAPQGGFLAAFDSGTGRTLAILSDEHYLSDIRTAAAGALAARLLAPKRVDTALILGAGVQAYWQARALHRERPFRRLLIWARSSEKATALKRRLSKPLHGVEIAVADNIEPAVRTADVVITATLSREPIVRAAWLRPGQHITAVGADDSTKCELDAEALCRARVVVDSIETTVANGDVHRAIEAGEYDQSLIAGEIGDILAGRLVGRIAAEEITIAKFVGIGAQDLAAAEAALALLESNPTAKP